MAMDEQDWSKLRPGTVERKDPEQLARLVNKLEVAARREQEQVKRNLSRRIETYRRLREHKDKIA
jgi:ribosomal protein L18E